MKTVIVPLPAVVWGGLQGVVAVLDPELKARGYRQHVLLPEDGGVVLERLRAAGVSAECVSLPRLQRSPVRTLSALISFPQALARLARNPEVTGAAILQAVGVHHPHAPLLARSMRKPLVWQLHSDSISGPLRNLARHYIRGHHDGIIANGHRIGGVFYGDDFGSGNHGVFYPPIRVDEFAPDAGLRTKTRIALGLSPEDIVIATIGNRSWQKNHQLLMEVARQLKEDPRPLRILVIGAEVPNYADTYRREVHAMADLLNAERPGLVRFCFFPHGIAQAIHAIDVLLMTSHAEGIPLAVAECLAAGKPVISTDVGAIREIVPPGKVGFVEAEKDAGKLAEHIRKLIADPETYKAFSTRALEHAKTVFSPAAVAEVHAATYRRAECDAGRRG